MARVDPVVFFKDCLGVGDGLKVLCDASFMKWYCLRESDHAVGFGYLLKVDHLNLHTTWCVDEGMKSWYKLNAHKSHGVAKRVAEMQGLVRVCYHHENQIKNSEECVEEFLQAQSSIGYFFASLDQNVYGKIKKKYATPIITVEEGKLVLLPPTKAEENLFQLAKALRMQLKLEQQQKAEEERAPWEQELVEWPVERDRIELKLEQKQKAEEEQAEWQREFGPKEIEENKPDKASKNRKSLGCSSSSGGLLD